MMRRNTRLSRGVTVLEVLVSIFVLLIGITGVVSLFPIGVRLSQMSTDDVVSAMTFQNAIAAVRVYSNLLDRVLPYDANHPLGDVLAWAAGESDGIDGINGVVGNPPSDTEFDPDFSTGDDGGGRTLDVKDANKDDCALLLMTSGRAAWKLYRLGKDASNNPSDLSTFISGPTVSGCTDFTIDGVQQGDRFMLLGARDENHHWATIPFGFYDGAGLYQLGAGAAEGYGYLAIINRVHDSTTSFRVHVLVYKGYDNGLPPEANAPAVAYYTMIMSSDMFHEMP